MKDNFENNIRKILKTGIKNGNNNDKENNNTIICDSIVCGNNSNITINNINTIKKEKKNSKTIYNKGSIGYNVLMANNIKDLCKKVLDARCKTKPKIQHQKISKVFYNSLNKKFNVKNREELFSLSEEFASPIIDYLNELYDNTKDGRIVSAAKKTNYKHSVQHYFRIEKELLDKLNKDSHDDDLIDLRYRYFNVKSRKELTQDQWQIYIAALKEKFNNLLKDYV